MIGGIYGSLSGLVAAQKKMVVAAHNTANANTNGFKKDRVVLQESHPEGVQASVEQVNTPGPIFWEETSNGLREVEQSNVDLGEEAINLLLARRLFEANVSALDTQQEVLGGLLDIVE